jgi:hypothetical protein
MEDKWPRMEEEAKCPSAAALLIVVPMWLRDFGCPELLSPSDLSVMTASSQVFPPGPCR